jgi:hypothetical protein
MNMRITVKNGALLAIVGMALSIFVALIAGAINWIYDYDLYSSTAFALLNLITSLFHTIGLLLLAIALYQRE